MIIHNKTKKKIVHKFKSVNSYAIHFNMAVALVKFELKNDKL